MMKPSFILSISDALMSKSPNELACSSRRSVLLSVNIWESSAVYYHSSSLLAHVLILVFLTSEVLS